MKDIRHITTSFYGNIIGLAEFKNQVQIFDLNKLEVISEFETILDFGGQRFAISENGQICICGSWSRYGICAYETKTGKLIWQRKDLKQVQSLQILFSDKTKIFANFEQSVSRILDINTGLDIEKVKNVTHLFQSKYLPIDIFDNSSKLQLVDRFSQKVKLIIKRQSFATLDLDFANDCFVISESGGPLSCYEIISGRLLWRIPISQDGHFLRISFNEDLDKFIGITYPFFKGGNKKMKYINKSTGYIEKEISINCPIVTEFAINGQLLVTSDKQIIDIKNENVINWV